MQHITKFRIEHYDCPSEEQLIRLHLEGKEGVMNLSFDLFERSVTITHTLSMDELSQSISSLSLGKVTVLSESSGSGGDSIASAHRDRRLLWMVLLINFACFLLEIIAGILSRSMGLAADALDMLADAAVYGLSIYAIGGSIKIKRKIARMSGYLQVGLATLGLTEVIRRFVFHIPLPDVNVMILVSVIALIGNIASLLILQKSGNTQVHFRASIIFTSNDIIANACVILAAVFVSILQTGIPDLVIGTLVFILVARGAISILKLARG